MATAVTASEDAKQTKEPLLANPPPHVIILIIIPLRRRLCRHHWRLVFALAFFEPKPPTSLLRLLVGTLSWGLASHLFLFPLFRLVGLSRGRERNRYWWSRSYDIIGLRSEAKPERLASEFCRMLSPES
eukprot:GHVU01234701.1.p1 GENE.GHVU01234701.1~~GHVU01234701.1.p1  ORF type:complete len:129 (+),score=5.52 GHVU01234701.1:116-502(+)